MEIQELTSNTLTIVFKRSWLSRLYYLFSGAVLLAVAIYIAGWGWYVPAKGEYAAYAPLFLVCFEIFLVVGSFFFITSAFDAATYRFDKLEDQFFVRRRKYAFKRWATAGPVSGITSVACEVRRSDDDSHSEIYLTYRNYGVSTETLKCGTGEVAEDEAITDTIKTFIELRN